MATEWFYTTNKQQMGPVSWDELRELANGGMLKPHDMVWTEGMEEWIKAINQKGLFVDGGDDEPVSSGKKSSAYTDAKPPPGRRKRVEDDEEEDEEDEKLAKRKARQKEQERAKMAVGLKVGLIVGGVVLVLLMIGCAGLVAVGLIFGLSGGAQAPKNQSFQVMNLKPMTHQDRQFTFQKGKRFVVTANSQVTHPQTDVDLHIMRGAAGEDVLVADISIGPNSRVDFTVPSTGVYRVRIVNLGPGNATLTNVNVNEQ